jgi:NADH oxidase (H2O2-forming)
MKTNTNVLILGGGPAGIQAARYIKNNSPETSVTVVRPEPHSMIYCALPYAIEGLFPLSKTFKSDELLTEFGAELIRDRVRKVDFDDREVELEDGSQIGYEKLLIVTGAVPIRPPLPGIDLENVYTVKSAADVRKIMHRLSGNTDEEIENVSGIKDDLVTVVIGSGAIGIEQATAFRNLGAEVHLVEMRNHVLPNLVDRDMSDVLQKELEDMGINLHLGVSVKELLGDKEAESVVLSDGSHLDLLPGRDLVIAALGMRADVDFLDHDAIKINRDGIVIDNRMRTSVPNVWAAGDCAAGWSIIDGEELSGKLATNAVPMGKVAGKDILGHSAHYPGFINGAATVVGKWRVAGTGFTESFAAHRGLDVYSATDKSTTRFPMMPDAGNVKIKLVVDSKTGRVVGGQIVGSEAVAERIDVITLAIQQGMTAQQLSSLSYSSQPWQTFFPAKNAIVEAATVADSMLESKTAAVG